MTIPLILALLVCGGLATAAPVAAQAPTCAASDSAYFAGTAIADREDWYGKHLQALGERAFCATNVRPGAHYRLLWLPSFDPTVLVQLDSTTAGWRLRAKRLSGAGGYEPGHLVRDTTIRLGPRDLQALRPLLRQTHFWQLPTVPPPDGTAGADGAQWVLEGSAAGRYHVVDRWSPEPMGPDSAFRALATWLLTRSGLVAPTLISDY